MGAELADGPNVVIGVDWSHGEPSVRLLAPGDTESQLVPLVGLRLNYRASPASRRRCLGHVPFRRQEGDYRDCTNAPEPGSRKCERCGIVDATFASNLHHAHVRGRAELDPEILAHLDQPNFLYLAAFRDGSVKVGTTSSRRTMKRLSEQAAWRAVLAASADDGFAVRIAEDRVTADLGLPQSVGIARKLDGMVTPRPDRELEAELGRYASQVHDVVEALGDERLAPVDEPWSFPGASEPTWDGLHRYPLRLDSGSHDLEVVAACGRLVVLRRPAAPTDRFVADLDQLFGVELDVGDYRSDELAVQDTLF